MRASCSRSSSPCAPARTAWASWSVTATAPRSRRRRSWTPCHRSAAANFDQLLTLLRYFSAQDLVDKLRAAPREQRAAAWHELYHRSDPDTATPQNEALDEYFRRIESANRRFAEAVTPGWQTDR